MNKLNDLSVVITGNPVLGSMQVSKYLKNYYEDVEMILPLLRGMVHIVEIDPKASNTPSYQINLLMETGGKESIIMDYVNSIIEDVLLDIADNQRVPAINILDECINIVKIAYSLSEDCKLVYNKCKALLNNVHISGKLFAPFKKEDGSLDINPLYLAQHSDNSAVVKLYNALYLCVKTYVNKGIQNSLLYNKGKADSMSNCITVEGEVDSLENFYNYVLYTTTNYPIIGQLIDTVKVTINDQEIANQLKDKADKLYIVLPNVNIDSIDYIKSIADCNYLMYLETNDKYSKDPQEVKDRISKFNTLVNPTVSRYYILNNNQLNLDSTMVLADSLAVSDSVPALSTILGNMDMFWVDVNTDSDDKIDNSELDEYLNNLKTADLFAEQGTEVSTEVARKTGKYKFDLSYDKVDIHLLNKELAKVGLNGYEPITQKILKWGETPTAHTDVVDNSTMVDNKRIGHIDDLDVDIHIVEELPLISDLTVDEIYQAIISDEEEFNKAIPDNEIIDSKIVDAYGDMCSQVIIETKNDIKELAMCTDDTHKYELLFAQLILGDFGTEVISRLVKNLNSKTLIDIFTTGSKVLSPKLKQNLIKSLLNVLANSARNYRKELGNHPTNKQVPYDNFTATEVNMDKLIENVFSK